MSKTEKKILEARAWRKKHSEDITEAAALDRALAHWESAQKKEQSLKVDLKAAKVEGSAAVKAVAKALKETKAKHKSAKAASPAEAPVPVKTQAVAGKKKTTGPSQKSDTGR